VGAEILAEAGESSQAGNEQARIDGKGLKPGGTDAKAEILPK
jgi:hypothetical protein